jgi:hydrogenase assembly chaperone HypC/HupF
MCIGIPMQVVAAEPGSGVAQCEGRGGRESVNVMLIGDQPLGTWILVFQGAGVRTMLAEEAAQTEAALAALEAVMAGDVDVNRHFADLVGREPELPAHLKGPES